MLRDECQSALMSKITNDDLTQFGTACFIVSGIHMATVGIKGLSMISRLTQHIIDQFGDDLPSQSLDW